MLVATQLQGDGVADVLPITVPVPAGIVDAEFAAPADQGNLPSTSRQDAFPLGVEDVTSDAVRAGSHLEPGKYMLPCDFLDEAPLAAQGKKGRVRCGKPASYFYERRPRPGVPLVIRKDSSLWAARCFSHQLSLQGTKSREHIPCTEEQCVVGQVMDS